MQQKFRATGGIVRPAEFEPGLGHSRRRADRRNRMAVASAAPGMRMRRVLVLVKRFQALCALQSDAPILVDLLHCLIVCSRETFTVDVRGGAVGHRQCGPSADQIKCLDELESLMQRMIRGAPQVPRGLAHSLDELLIQCVVFEARDGLALDPAWPSQR
jgi:hypothetical protein